MFVEFDSLQDSSRVWIYQSVRKLTEVEEKAIFQALLTFTQQWAAHGQPLRSSFKIFYNQLIVLAADENYNKASGCSIDESVHIIKEIDQHFALDLFNRTLVGFLNNKAVVVLQLKELSDSLFRGVWDQNTPVFNNLVSTKRELSTSWILPANQTWLKRYLTKITV